MARKPVLGGNRAGSLSSKQLASIASRGRTTVSRALATSTKATFNVSFATGQRLDVIRNGAFVSCCSYVVREIETGASVRA